MILFYILALTYSYLNSRRKLKDIALISGYFLVASLGAHISQIYFPFTGDELFYDHCGRNISQAISQGQFSGFSTELCDAAANNYFVNIVGYIYFLGGKNFYALIGFNALMLLMACDLFVKTFQLEKIKNDMLYYCLAFFPPIIYLVFRPSKEACILFLVSGMYHAASITSILSRYILFGFFASVLYFMRWQYAVAAVVAILFYELWKIFVEIENKKKLWLFVGTSIFVLVSWIFMRQDVMAYLNLKFFKEGSVAYYAKLPDGPLVYHFMIHQDGENALHEWNMFVAHAVGVFSPHLLRFVKEYLRDGIFDLHILSEFVFVSLWYYVCLPFFLIFFKEQFWDKRKNFLLISPAQFFNFIFSFFIFTLASMTVFFSTPQTFRYKLPLNLYLFGSVLFLLRGLNRDSLKGIWTKYRVFFILYAVFLFAYSYAYLMVRT